MKFHVKIFLFILLTFNIIFGINFRVKIADFKNAIYFLPYKNTKISVYIKNVLVDKITIKNNTTINLYKNKDLIQFNYANKRYQGQKFIIRPPENNKKIQVLKRLFRGNINIINLNRKCIVINELNIENYLKGIMKNEISPLWPEEALKTMAICARTYAYKDHLINKNNLYDAEATVHNQVYSGISGEHKNTNNAINLTKGLIIVYHDTPIQALYHACCGGYIENAYNVWGKSLPYTMNKKSDYCKNTPHYNFNTSIKKSILIKRLNSKYKKYIKDISDIIPNVISPSGRVIEYKIIYNKNSSFLINGNKFRSIVGYEILKSLRSTIEFNNNKIVFSGKGWGHGVGLCQWCMKKMAMKNISYKDIIKHFYYNVNIKKID